MKERPILFSTPMVQAIAEGRKTRTRRIIKLRNGDNPDDESISTHIDESFDKVMDFSKAFPYWQELECPYGRPGDRLWVREEHYLWGHWQKGGTTKTGKRKWKFVEADGQGECLYSDNPPQAMSISMDKTAPDMPHWYKRLARFMPKKYARHHLLVTHIRAERLLDISDSDAIAEGIRSFRPVPAHPYPPKPSTTTTNWSAGYALR